MPVTLNLSGSYEQMQTFLQSLERLNRYTSVTSLVISGGQPNFQCALKCFNGDFQAALLALDSINCIATKCQMQCQGVILP